MSYHSLQRPHEDVSESENPPSCQQLHVSEGEISTNSFMNLRQYYCHNDHQHLIFHLLPFRVSRENLFPTISEFSKKKPSLPFRPRARPLKTFSEKLCFPRTHCLTTLLNCLERINTTHFGASGLDLLACSSVGSERRTRLLLLFLARALIFGFLFH